MPLPEQIQKQVEEANAVLKDAYGDAGVTPVVSGETVVPSGMPDTSATQSTNSAPAATPATPVEDENSPTYAQRWRSLQGSFNAVQQRASHADERIRQLEALVATMQAAPPAQSAPAPVATTPLVTASDVETYGEPLVDFARRAAREENRDLMQALSDFNSRLAAMERHVQGLAPTVQHVAQRQNLSDEQLFFRRLGDAVPDYGTVNSDPRFHEWLLSPDPMTGIVRQTYLQDAQNSFDAQRAINIFLTFKQAFGASQQVVPAANAAPAQTNVVPMNSRQAELERQVAPGRRAPAPTPTGAQGRIWAPAEITAFYSDVRRGAFRGREADQRAIEADIFSAQREGRIDQSAA
jgi:hypothetical protein